MKWPVTAHTHVLHTMYIYALYKMDDVCCDIISCTLAGLHVTEHACMYTYMHLHVSMHAHLYRKTQQWIYT